MKIFITLMSLAVCGNIMAVTCSKVTNVEGGGRYINDQNRVSTFNTNVYTLENGEQFITNDQIKVFDLALISKRKLCYTDKQRYFSDNGFFNNIFQPIGKYYLHNSAN